jgi:thioredoxin-related protein
MKQLIFLAVLLFTAHLGYSQKSEGFWFGDIEEASDYATTNEVPILMVFAGSDWCKPCMQFKKDILTSEQFTDYASGKLAILYLDFPMRKQNKLSEEQTAHNEKLAEKYNKSGAFPAILLMDANQNVYGPLEFKRQSPDDFIKSCKALL